MMQDIKRICTQPTQEDRDWFPDIAGAQDWRGCLKGIWANYRDESFVGQFLSPRLIREFKLFLVSDQSTDRHVSVEAIHNDDGYRKVRAALAASYDIAAAEPDIQIRDVDLRGDRELVLRHNVRKGILLSEQDRAEVLKHVHRLWGYGVRLEGVDFETDETLYKTVVGATGDDAGTSSAAA
jgi:spore cortex formation protein SpoVR/YcgB (stage V sporulation)